MSEYSFGRHDVRPESKVTQTIVRRRRNQVPIEDRAASERVALAEANAVLEAHTDAVRANRRGYRQGFFHGLVIAVLGGLLLYAATHLH